MKKQTKTEGVRYAQTYPLLIYPYVIAFSLLLNHAITLLFHNSKRSMQHTTRDCNKRALLKRGYYGIYHFMSSKHLERYIQEFAFRHNTASWETMNFIDRTFEMMYGKHISYKELTN